MTQGEDADAALAALQTAILSGLEDEEEQAAEALSAEAAHGWTPAVATQTVQGLSASPGLAIGPLCHFRQRKIVVASTAKDPAAEEKRLQEAIAMAQSELDQIYQEVKTRSGAGKAAIFRAHIEFLNDAGMTDETLGHIRKGHSAGWSWQQAHRRAGAGDGQTG